MADTLKKLAGSAAAANLQLAKLFGVPVFLVDLILGDLNRAASSRLATVKRKIVSDAPEFTQDMLDDALEFMPATKDRPDIKVFVHASRLEDKLKQRELNKASKAHPGNQQPRLFAHGSRQQSQADHSQATARVHLPAPHKKTITGNVIGGPKSTHNLRPLQPLKTKPLRYQARRMQTQHNQVGIETRGNSPLAADLKARLEKEFAA